MCSWKTPLASNEGGWGRWACTPGGQEFWEEMVGEAWAGPQGREGGSLKAKSCRQKKPEPLWLRHLKWEHSQPREGRSAVYKRKNKNNLETHPPGKWMEMSSQSHSVKYLPGVKWNGHMCGYEQSQKLKKTGQLQKDMRMLCAAFCRYKVFKPAKEHFPK